MLQNSIEFQSQQCTKTKITKTIQQKCTEKQEYLQKRREKISYWSVQNNYSGLSINRTVSIKRTATK